MMRNLTKTTIVCLILTLLMNCNRDDSVTFETEKLKIDSVNIPQNTMKVNAVQTIITYSTHQQGCEGFYGYDYARDGFTRTITSYKFKQNATCGNAVAGVSQLNFAPQEKGTYTLKFWSGDNNWLEKTIVVE